jgi:hypothetical protein
MKLVICGYRKRGWDGGRDDVIVFGINLLVSEYFPPISIIFWTIGLIILATGVVFLVLGKKGRAFGRHRYRY